MEDFTAEKSPAFTPYVPLVAGTIARSLACISIYPVELARTRMQVIILRGLITRTKRSNGYRLILLFFFFRHLREHKGVRNFLAFGRR